MRATDLLMGEHLRIRCLLDALEAVVGRAEASGRVADEGVMELLALFDAFADGWHQDKEEQHLFPRLIQRAGAGDGRRVRALLHDHIEERRRLMSLRSHLVSATYGEPLSLRELARDARELIQLHRRHMAEEGAVVFPLAERLLTREDDAEIVSGFERVDAEYGVSRRLLERMAALCDRLSGSKETPATDGDDQVDPCLEEAS